MKTEKEILEELRKQSQIPGSMTHLMYSMLNSAHPTIKENFEKQAVMMMKVGYELGKEMTEADKDPTKKAQWEKLLDGLASQIQKPEEKEYSEE